MTTPGTTQREAEAGDTGGRGPVFLPRAEVERRVGLRRSAIYRRMAEGRFPRAVHDIDSATVWWLESEIEGWQRERIAARDMGRSMGSEHRPLDSAQKSTG